MRKLILALALIATPAHAQTIPKYPTVAEAAAAKRAMQEANAQRLPHLLKPGMTIDQLDAGGSYAAETIAWMARWRPDLLTRIMANTPAQTCDLAGAEAKGRADERAAIVQWIEGRK